MARKFTEDERVIGAFLNNFRMVDFQKVLRDRKEAILKTAVNKMQGYLTRDVEILQEIIEDPNTSPQTKVNAIQTLMNQLRDWTTTTDIIKRLEALQDTSGNVSDTF